MHHNVLGYEWKWSSEVINVYVSVMVSFIPALYLEVTTFVSRKNENIFILKVLKSLMLESSGTYNIKYLYPEFQIPWNQF